MTQSPIIQQGVRLASPLAVVVGIYLLFAGHNNPGGGFAAGLVLGSVVALRVITGVDRPAWGNGLIAIGLLVVLAVAIMPMLWGDTVLDQKIISANLPLLGKVKTGSALPFDIGVTAIVVGLVVLVLQGLNAEHFAGEPSAGEPTPRSKSTEGSR